jgi:hypothetical protein
MQAGGGLVEDVDRVLRTLQRAQLGRDLMRCASPPDKVRPTGRASVLSPRSFQHLIFLRTVGWRQRITPSSTDMFSTSVYLTAERHLRLAVEPRALARAASPTSGMKCSCVVIVPHSP